MRKTILDDDDLLRTLFDAEQYNPRTGKLEKLAIPTSDLKERGLSLDIKRLAKKAVVLKRIEIQQHKAQERFGKDDTTRKDIFISEFSRSRVCQLVDLNSDTLFDAVYDPIPGNDAHTIINCIKRDEKKSYYLMARNKLEPLILENIIQFDDYKFIER